MTVPAVPDDPFGDRTAERTVERTPEGIVLWPLPEYEPDDIIEPPRRWSSLRPATGPQLALIAGPDERPDEPPIQDLTLWMLVRRMLEVLDGRRPIGQLHRLLPGTAFEALLTRLRITRPGTHHKLRRLRTCFPTRQVVEVAAVIDVTDPEGASRVIAAAARFERIEGTWPCTVLRLM